MKSQENTTPKNITRQSESRPTTLESTPETTIKGNISWS